MVRELIQLCFKDKTVVDNQVESFDEFIYGATGEESRLQRTISKTSIGDDVPVEGLIKTDIPGFEVKLGKVRLAHPIVREADGSSHNLTPMEARLRNLTYAANLHLEFIPVRDGIEYEAEEVQIGTIPIMVRSRACNTHCSQFEKQEGRKLTTEEYHRKIRESQEDPQDPGGYFIVNGTERVLVGLEDLAPNQIFVEFDDRYGTRIEVAKVFSQREGYRSLVVLEKRKDGELVISLPAASGQVPLVVLMKALGEESEEEILKAVGEDPEIARYIYANIESCASEYSVMTAEDAINFLGKKLAAGQAKEYRIKRVENLLDKSLLPHLGNAPEDRPKKVIYLGRIARKVLELALDRRGPDDKDHYANKRLKLSGDLMEDLFRVSFTGLLKDLKYQLERAHARNRDLKIRTAVRSDVLTERLMHALATGNWVGGRVGISQLLDRTCNMGTISHLRRIVSPLTRSQPHFEARDLHSTQWGRFCPNETPEGPNCGLVKNYALLVEISKGYDTDEIERALYDLGVEHIIGKNHMNHSQVYLNDRPIGVYEDPLALVDKIKSRRRQGLMSPEINVKYDYESKDVLVYCDSGRVRRPLVVLHSGKLATDDYMDDIRNERLTWNDLIKEGAVEYIDASEEENLYVAIDEKAIKTEMTHMEIDPVTMLGVCINVIPYPEHNSSPRNTMGSGMIKQSISFGSSNYRIRPDTRGHLLHYPQRPMVQTAGMDLVGFKKRSAGQNIVVMVMPYHGYNMEDALVMNQSSVDRGFGRSTFFRTYEAEERRYPGGQEDRFEIPSQDVVGVRSEEEYVNLDTDGVILPERAVKENNIIIGRTSPPRFLEEPTEFLTPQKRRETSITVRHEETGLIDSVMISESENGSRLVKVKVRDQRVPQLGDKFSSRHGQKGVVGILVSQADMPFTEDGVCPDIVVNPHAIPSRMTVGHVLEMIAGKVGSLEGRPADATGFSGEKEDDLRKALVKNGFKHDGKEAVYDGRTGRKFEADIFTGVIYYQKLHHMVAGKMHARSRGPVQILTHQPTEGRAREGGLRFGEMEKDCLIAHGAAMIIRDRLLDESDRTVVYVCKKCGYIAMRDRRGNLRCSVCGDDSDIHPIEMSYAFKLLLGELEALCIAPKLKLEGLV